MRRKSSSRYERIFRMVHRGTDMMYRGWVGGYTDYKKKKKKIMSLYSFDWTVVGQFDENKVRLLNRNNGLLLKSLEISKNRIEICKLGTKQIGLFGDKEMITKKLTRKDIHPVPRKNKNKN